jgi:hypothetical protein
VRFGNAGRTLRYRKLLVRQNVQLRNKVSQMLMELGVVYNKQKLHKVGYFKEMMEPNQDIGRELRPLLTICRETLVRIGKTEMCSVTALMSSTFSLSVFTCAAQFGVVTLQAQRHPDLRPGAGPPS